MVFVFSLKERRRAMHTKHDRPSTRRIQSSDYQRKITSHSINIQNGNHIYMYINSYKIDESLNMCSVKNSITSVEWKHQNLNKVAETELLDFEVAQQESNSYMLAIFSFFSAIIVLLYHPEDGSLQLDKFLKIKMKQLDNERLWNN